jgi:nitroimidazol reductase NimA-like FMN-containing flavoprotein (pyridoxamine 5'-phosphate oxidase superfamily)
MWIRDLTTLECKHVLDANRLAHLACSNDGRPYLVPIYCAHADNALYAFSMPGKKIEWMRTNPLVSVLVEEHKKGREWRTVIADRRQRDHAWSLLSKNVDWWEPGALRLLAPPVSDHSSHIFFRVLIDQLTGREARE